jgi:hypothetical protein
VLLAVPESVLMVVELQEVVEVRSGRRKTFAFWLVVILI